MWKAVADVAQAALFYVLLDWVEGFLLGDLHLCVRPTGNLDNHVENAITLVSEKRDVVPGGHNGSILFDVHTVFLVDINLSEWHEKIEDITQCIRRTDETRTVHYISPYEADSKILRAITRTNAHFRRQESKLLGKP
jgi:hypothetical protein